jgi:predicted DNA-binding transcriptional regulator
LLFFYPNIQSAINIGSTADVHFWVIATQVAIAFIAILGIGAWIGYTMFTTPPPKPIEEITTEPSNEKTQTMP